ncbi:methionine synthase [Saccharopolyspora sp. HNM0983]|uniref:Methionine synthase n=1 Tax=Saccharopolyspora montiporae TaxID=2781240 RepID=A0A929G131_9PSEU|nr:methionine synthase [Saccharopolyspora sp. HNM0983]
MTDAVWGPGIATAIGSMPGTDPVEAARTVLGEFPELVPMPELPARGVGADVLGRTAGMLVDLAVEVVPSGYRVAAPGRDQRRAQDLLRWDVDAIEQAAAEAGAPRVVKLAAAGPWTLAAGIELARGHRVLTDAGALRDFTASLTEGLLRRATEIAERTGSRVVVQLDEPSLPAVLNGWLATPSGYGTVPAVPEPEVRGLLSEFIEHVRDGTGEQVVVHCCAARPPVELLRRAGAGAVALDATGLGEVSGRFADELGEAWEEGTTLLLGLVPGTDPPGEVAISELAAPARGLASRLGFHRRALAERAVPTPVCGLAGASPTWSRRAMSLTRDLASAFADELA